MTDLDRATGGDADAGGDSSLNRRITRGAVWMIGLRLANRFVGLISTIVLARLLVPADFGLIALAIAMVGAIGIFGEFGFEMVLIQNQKAERRHYDTAWTLSVLRGVIAALIVLLLAEPLANLFEDPRLADIIMALALLPLIEGSYNIGTVAFRKELTFNKEFVFRMVPRLIGAAMTISFAIAWRDYWALVYGTIAGASLRLVMSFAMHRFRPRPSLAALGEIMDFSKWMLLTSIVSFANRKADTFLIAKFLDAAALGTFALSRQISNMASAEVIAPIKQALFPGYAKLAHDVTLLRKAFVDAYSILVLIALPIAIGIGVTADLFVPILLGPQWLGTIPLIQLLVISGGLRAVSSHARPVYLAMNRPSYGAYASLGQFMVFLPILIISLLHYGVVGAVIAHAVAQLCVMVGSLYLMHRLIGLSFAQIFTAGWRALAATALMAGAVAVVKQNWPFAAASLLDQIVLLAGAVLAGMITYVGTVMLLWRFSGAPANSAESYLLAYAHSALRKQRERDLPATTGSQS